jgi:hypothetical protein
MVFLSHLLAHAAIFIGFLPFLYFIYVGPSQTLDLGEQFFNLIKPNLTTFAVVSNPGGLKSLNNLINDGIENTANTLPDTMQESNKKIFNYTIIISSVTVFVFFTIAILLEYLAGNSILEFMISNLIVLAFVAASEFAIVGIFLRSFIVLDSDYFKGITVVQLEDMKWSNCKNVSKLIQDLLPSFIADRIYE